MTEKTSVEYTLYGDLDGLTVADLRKILDDYPDDARIVVYSEPIYGYGGWTDETQDYFRFKWEEK